MPDIKDLAGSYLGRCRVRDGMEGALAPAERNRFLKNTETLPLELRDDWTFSHKGTTEGSFTQDGEVLNLVPISFAGLTEPQMRQAAEDAGRTFGLGWLFAPFQLKISGEALVSGDDKALVYTEYLRKDRT